MGNTSTTHKRHSSGEDGTPVFSSHPTPNKFVYPQMSTSMDGTSDGVEFIQGSFKGMTGTACKAPPLVGVDRNLNATAVPANQVSASLPVPQQAKTKPLLAQTAVETTEEKQEGSPALEQHMLSNVIRTKVIPTVFKWKGTAQEVHISGSFNGWKNKLPMVKSQGDFYTIIDLPEGSHQYKFYVDGAWSHDPAEKTTSNNLGSLNNVVHVKKSDFEVFEALDQDCLDTRASSKKGSYSSSSPPGDYSQEIPSRKPERHTNPPVLPPHLLQVILNKEIPVHCEPNLLPEPNHVMLNHLYALSIKDGVMVLSATHRYRKKYVTTLLYKPI